MVFFLSVPFFKKKCVKVPFFYLVLIIFWSCSWTREKEKENEKKKKLNGIAKRCT